MQIATDLTMDNDFNAVSIDPTHSLIEGIKNLKIGSPFGNKWVAVPIDFDKDVKYMDTSYRDFCADCARPLNLLKDNMETSYGTVCPICRISYLQVDLADPVTNQSLAQRSPIFGF